MVTVTGGHIQLYRDELRSHWQQRDSASAKSSIARWMNCWRHPASAWCLTCVALITAISSFDFFSQSILLFFRILIAENSFILMHFTWRSFSDKKQLLYEVRTLRFYVQKLRDVSVWILFHLSHWYNEACTYHLRTESEKKFYFWRFLYHKKHKKQSSQGVLLPLIHSLICTFYS